MRDRYASLREGLVGAWIPSVSGSGLLLPDLSGNGNNGALTNMGPEDWVSSQYGRALDFDGVNDYAASDFDTAMPSGGETRTMCAWINANTFTGNLITYGTDFLAQRSELGLRTGGWVVFAINGGAWGSTGLVAGKWSHVAIIASQILSNTLVYINGVNVPSSKQAGADLTINTVLNEKIQIGVNIPRTGFFYDGQLDDVRIYNRALSEPEIKLLASRPGIGLKPQRRTMYYAPPTGARRRRILTSMP